MLQLGYGYISGDLIKGQPYTLKYTRSLGFFYYDEFETYLKWYIQNNATLVSIIKKGAFPEDVYITIIPVVDNLTSSGIVNVINSGVNLFRKKYSPDWSISTFTFVDIISGAGVEVITKEGKEAGLPAWGKDLAIIGGITIVAAVAIMAIVKKV